MKLRERKKRPRKLAIYGTHGVGKSTFAAAAPSPIFIDLEGGLADIDVPATEQITDWYTFQQTLQELRTEEHGYATVVIDTVDWLERLIHAEVARANNVESIDKIDFGKGYGFATPYWNFVLSTLDCLLDERNMMTILLAHSAVTKFSPPDSESYDRYEPALHKVASRIIQEWADDFLFAKFKVFTTTAEKNFGKERKIAIDAKQRILLTSESAAAVAKNRLRLPEELPMNFEAYATFAYPVAADNGNINGVIKNGSSK